MNQESWSSINNRSSLNLYFVSERETVKSSVGNAGFYTTRFGKRSVGPMAAFLNQERPEDYQLPDRYCLFSMCLHLRHKLFLENVTGSVPASDLMRTRLSSGATWRRRCLSSASTPNSWGDWSALTLTEQFTMIKWLSGQDPLKYLDKKKVSWSKDAWILCVVPRGKEEEAQNLRIFVALQRRETRAPFDTIIMHLIVNRARPLIEEEFQSVAKPRVE